MPWLPIPLYAAGEGQSTPAEAGLPGFQLQLWHWQALRMLGKRVHLCEPQFPQVKNEGNSGDPTGGEEALYEHLPCYS